jgi:hypothetical protein
MNNPLNLTDPSGFSWLSKAFSKIGNWIKKNWRTIVAIVVVIVAWYIAPYIVAGFYGAAGIVTTPAVFQGVAGAVAGAIGGAANAAIAGGDASDILRGALVGGIQGGISGGILHHAQVNASSLADKALHVAGHGVLGGASNVAMGGKFQDGFLSAAAGAAASWTGVYGAVENTGVVGRTITAGVIGGTASALGGGKFANGAWTAAFQHLLNAEGGNTMRNIGNGLAKTGKFGMDILGKIWNLPNTAIGLAWGGIGLAAEIVAAPFKGWDFNIFPGYNSIMFTGHNLAGTAQALGNTTHYSSRYDPNAFSRAEGHTIGQHEMMHTYQGQQIGILYLPAVIASYGLSLVMNGNTHGAYSFMERGPQTYGSNNKPWNFSSSYRNPYPGKWNLR